MISRDASGWNYGRKDDPDHPRYNFARDVDYCSGACVMVPRSLFQELGGFDSLYNPAYYEDVDLAFKIRHSGHRVIYQPLARVIHCEGVTSGTSLESGVKSYQRANQPKFRQRWSARLDTHPEPDRGSRRIVHAHGPDFRRRSRVLVIDHREPTPDRDCGSLRLVEIIQAILRSGHHVTFVPDTLTVSSPYLENLQKVGVEVIRKPFYQSVLEYLKQYGHEYHLVIISRAAIVARHMTAVRRFAPQARVVFDTVDLQFLREERQTQVQEDPELKAAVAKRREQELRLVHRADLTLVVSPNESAVLERECPGAEVMIVPTIYPVSEADPPEFAGRRDIVFIGGFSYPPNVDAVLYFIKEIFPLIHPRLPEAVFRIIGSDPPAEICQFSGPSIDVMGYVSDATPVFDQARVSVAPLRFGAGVKGKVNQSMVLGVPTVVTSIAAEGMFLVHEENAMIADEPAAFADAVVRAWRSEDLWNKLSAGGHRNLRDHFSVEVGQKRVEEVLAWAGLPCVSGINSP